MHRAPEHLLLEPRRSIALVGLGGDLYYRLAVIEVVLSPLRARREDISVVAEAFYQRFSGKSDPLPQELLSTLLSRSWPGNVRELRNFVQRCVTLGVSAPASPGSTDSARPSANPNASNVLPVDLSLPLKDGRDDALNRFELLHVENVLRSVNGNVTRAAERSGVSRRFLQRLIARLGIRGAVLDADEEAGDAGEDE